MAKTTKKTENLVLRGKTWWMDWTHCEPITGRAIQRYRLSLNQVAGEKIQLKERAIAVMEATKTAIREGRFRGTLANSEKTDEQLKAETTVSEVVKDYKALYLPTLAPTMDETPFLTRFERTFGTTAMCAITTLDMERYFDGLRQPERLHPRHKAVRVRSVATIDKHLIRLRHLFNWAMDRQVIDATPFRDSRSGRPLIKRISGQEPRRCPVDVTDQARILAEVEGDHVPAVGWIVVAIDTGLRHGEQFGRWSRNRKRTGKTDTFDPTSGIRVRDMNFFTGRLTVRAEVAKTRKRRVIKIATRRALKALKDACQPNGVPRHPDALIFVDIDGQPLCRTTPLWRLQKAAKACGIKVWWHALRRFFGANALSAGVAAPFIQKAYGHADPKMTAWYLDIDEDDSLDAALSPLSAVVEPADTMATQEGESIGKTA